MTQAWIRDDRACRKDSVVVKRTTVRTRSGVRLLKSSIQLRSSCLLDVVQLWNDPRVEFSQFHCPLIAIANQNSLLGYIIDNYTQQTVPSSTVLFLFLFLFRL